MLTCVDGLTYHLTTERGRWRLELVEGAALLDPTRPRDLVTLTSRELRNCFEGSTLDRAHAVAALSAAQRAKLFPPPYDSHGSTLYQIGKVITDREVCAELADAPVWLLQKVAAHREPSRQLETAVRAQADRIASRRRRRA